MQKIINTRISQRHDTEERWNANSSTIPMAGEIIIYDPDATTSFARIKIGDGVTNVGNLPFEVFDIQLNGTSIITNGVATIPIITASKGGYGIVKVGNLANGNMGVRNSNGSIMLCYPEASINGLTNRKAQGSQYSGVICSSNFDLAVKIAMTDGIGTAWTEDEKAAARDRIGTISMEDVLDIDWNKDGEVFFDCGGAPIEENV